MRLVVWRFGFNSALSLARSESNRELPVGPALALIELKPVRVRGAINTVKGEESGEEEEWRQGQAWRRSEGREARREEGRIEAEGSGREEWPEDPRRNGKHLPELRKDKVRLLSSTDGSAPHKEPKGGTLGSGAIVFGARGSASARTPSEALQEKERRRRS